MRVLLVDDERFFRELFSGWLSAAGHVVESFDSAGDALDRFEQGGVDMVLTDLAMPDADGLAFVGSLRDRDASVPVVVVTHREDIRSVTQALKLGVEEYLLKPVDREMLLVATERAAEVAGMRREHSRLSSASGGADRAQAVQAAALEIVSELDADRVQDRFLAALVRATGAQGAALWIRERDAEVLALRADSGVLAPELLTPRLDLTDAAPATRRLREKGAHLDGGRSLWVPLVRDGTLVGAALAADKLAGLFDEGDAVAARTLADHAAVALRTAERVGALQRIGLRDRETSAYNITYFIDYAGKEIYKARRYGRAFSLITLQVDNLALLQSALPGDTTRTIQRSLIGSVERLIRDADVLARVTDDTFYLLLPETDHFGARMFVRRVVAAFGAEAAVAELSIPPSVAVGTATWPADGEDFDELLASCAQRQDEMRRSPYRRLHLEDQPFWDLVDTLLTSEARAVVDGDAGRRTALTPPEWEALLAEVARSSQAEPASRGLVYLGGRDLGPEHPLVRPLDPAREREVRLYLLSRAGEDALEHPSVTAVFLPDEVRLDNHRFLLWMTERATYAALEGPDGAAYHTSDPSLVEALVARLQDAYALQRQF